MKKIAYPVLLIVLALGLIITACSQPAPAPTASPSPAPSPTAKPSPTATPTPTATAAPKPAAIKEWISATASETTYGYTVGATLARVANKELEKQGIPVRMKNVTGPGSTVNFRSYDKGETDMFYMNTPAQLQAWTNTGPFEKDLLKHKSYQGVYFFSSDLFALIRSDSKDKIKSFADFAGKKVFPQPMGSAGYEAVKSAFEALGIWNKIDPRPITFEQFGSSLKTGAVDAGIATAIAAGRSSPPWLPEMILTTDVNVVNPTDAEKKAIAGVKGLTPTIFPAERLFGKKNVGVTDVWCFSIYQGWNFPAYGTTDEVYAFVKAWYEHTDDLVAIDPGFKQFAEDGLKFNAMILDSLSEVPIHPGVAKYYKEKGIWKSSWKEGQVLPKDW
ncbi:MAG: TAXI family TRAP transporter solute-binding subunit [Dehalococcoidales bacterium]|nr:TAXI family TRAP transporter solute-binding subunit [Dehalococcoidales bacterium]